MAIERLDTTEQSDLTNSERHLKSRLHNALSNFYSLPLNHHNPDHTHTPEHIQSVEERVWEDIHRNNRIIELQNHPRFIAAKEREMKLKGPAKIGRTKCIEGRLPNLPPGDIESDTEIPGGAVDTIATSDGKIRPASSFLCVSIQNDAEAGVELVEFGVVHLDSTNFTHGCAANEMFVNNIKRKSPDMIKGLLDYDQYSQIQNVSPQHLDEANLIILRYTTIPAFEDFYNKIRSKNYEPLKKVAIGVRFDTATMGYIFEEDGKQLKTADLTNEFKQDIAKNIQKDFGLYSESFTDEDYLLDLYETVVDIEELLLDTNSQIGGETNKYFEKINSYFNEVYPEFTKDQMKALRLETTRQVAFQYATGSSVIPEEGPTHPYSHKVEDFMSISLFVPFGIKDTKQAFCSSASSPEMAVSQIDTKWSVMDVTKVDLDRPRILYVSNTVHSSDFEKRTPALYKEIAANIALSSEIFSSDSLRTHIANDRLAVIHLLLSENGTVIDVLDHSNLH